MFSCSLFYRLASYDATFKALTEKISKVEKDTADILKRLETVKCIRLAEIEDQKTLLKQLQKVGLSSSCVLLNIVIGGFTLS